MDPVVFSRLDLKRFKNIVSSVMIQKLLIGIKFKNVYENTDVLNLQFKHYVVSSSNSLSYIYLKKTCLTNIKFYRFRLLHYYSRRKPFLVPAVLKGHGSGLGFLHGPGHTIASSYYSLRQFPSLQRCGYNLIFLILLITQYTYK